ncbi:16S rRNA (guanine(527)-N(7))-methyltransferase RsmG [Flavobacteriaceae bacterium F08102]|nr:16S rRNA (guanine(527)-N(7))-methyltransferase RsmG [Flavobacteriaceae bacterium F08102]
MEIVKKYFANLSPKQIAQFDALEGLYREWNAQINVISRKDIDALYERHVLHSLGIAKRLRFEEGSSILDVGTGGGFPGIPLAILFPKVNFHLVDAIGKKITVVNEVVKAIGLTNVKTTHGRVEKIKGNYDFIVSRAVTNMDDFVKWVRKKIAKKQQHSIKNGILYLKGGDLTEELRNFPSAQITDLRTFFTEEFFETKKIVYLPIKYRP